MKSLVYVSTTNIYLEYIGYMFRPVNRSSSGHQSNKSKVLAYPGILFGGGGVQQIQLRTEDRENGDLGAVAL